MYTTHRLQEIFRSGSREQRELVTFHVVGALTEYLPWMSARRLIGLNIMETDDGFLLVLKAYKGKKAQVAFTNGSDLAEVFHNLVYFLLFDLASWRDDKFRSMRSDKKKKNGKL